jgi:hypothetical protein
MKLSHLYLGLIIALAVLNMIVFAIHCHRCGAGQARKVKSARKLFRRLSKKLFIRPAGAYLVVVKDCSMRLGNRSTYTAMEGARVVSAGARGLAMAGSHILAQDGAETIALEGSNTVGEAGSVTHAYTGAIVRAKRAAAVKLGMGVKAYARAGCQVFDDGGNIYNTGDPSVLEGFEPALVVGEADSFIYAGEGSVVIAEPQVIVKSVP